MMGKKKDAAVATVAESQALLGSQLSFAGTEAYKLLQTNVALTLPQKDGCHIIGITSTFAAEGKSTTSANLAYALAEDGRSVLLVEADMRKPTVAQRLDVKPSPGLSNLLVGQCGCNEAAQAPQLHKNLRVITAGDIPPNPPELLNSSAMKRALEVFSKAFDYILLDLPPISAVADALVTTKLVDSVLVVLRRDYCRRQALQKTLRQLELVNAKVWAW